MDRDPWAWTNQPASTPLSNTLQVPRAQEATPSPAPIQQQQGPLGMAQNIAVNKGVNYGVDKASSTLFPKAPLGSAPVETAVPSWSATPGTVGSATSMPVTAGVAEGVALPALEAATPALGAPIGSAAAGAGATTAATTGALAGAEAVAAGTAATTAATAASGAAAAATTAAAVGAPAAVAAGTGAAAAAPALAAMGPIGWGIGAVLLAKQLKIF